MTGQALWFIAIVVDINDPEKRRRIKARCSYETESTVPLNKLLWLQPIQLCKDSFSLPVVQESVLVIELNNQRFWLELPNKAAWKDFGDDYATAWLFTHKDVLSAIFRQSTGFEFKLAGNIKLTTNKTTTNITDDSIDFTYDKVHISTDGKSCSIIVNDITISTDGKLVSVKNGSQDLLSLINDLHKAIQQHTHQSSCGPTSIAINKAVFVANQTNFSKLLK